MINKWLTVAHVSCILYQVQKTVLYGDAQTRMAELMMLQRMNVDTIVAAIDRADEARKAGYSNHQIWALYGHNSHECGWLISQSTLQPC